MRGFFTEKYSASNLVDDSKLRNVSFDASGLIHSENLKRYRLCCMANIAQRLLDLIENRNLKILQDDFKDIF
jgi:hypothetical protein